MVKIVKLPIGTHLIMREDVTQGEWGKAWYKDEEVKVRALVSVNEKDEVIVADDGAGVRPDYAGQIYRGRHQFGYKREEGEKLMWMLIIACPADHPAGASACTIDPIAAGNEVALIDVFDGNPYHQSEAGWDYVIKEFWVSFSQPCRFLMYQEKFAGGDVSCLGYYEARSMPVNTFVVGWTRSLLEDINEEGKLYVYVKNEGSDSMTGKCWLCGYEKKGAYDWL